MKPHVFSPLLLICHSPLLPLPQEASPRLPAAGNAAVRVALAAQKGKEGESGEGEERQRAVAEEEQSQEDEVRWRSC